MKRTSYLFPRVFHVGRQCGFGAMELLYSQEQSNTVSVADGAVDSWSVESSSGIGFRGLYSGSIGYSYTERIDGASVRFLVEGARENAEMVKCWEPLYRGPEDRLHRVMPQHTRHVSQTEMVNLACEISAHAQRIDKRVQRVESMVGTLNNEVSISSTEGLDLTSQRGGIVAALKAIVSEGNDTQSSARSVFAKSICEVDPVVMATSVVGKAVSMLGSTRIASGTYRAILQSDAARLLLGAFYRWFCADFSPDASPPSQETSENVVSSLVTVIDDPSLENRPYSRDFDDEGVPTHPTLVIESGLFKTRLHNLKTAAEQGASSTGNGRRDYKSRIAVGPSNLFLLPRDTSLMKLISLCGDGVMINSLRGLHVGADIHSGRFSARAAGHIVRRGAIAEPITGFTLFGSMEQLLNDVIGVADDLTFGLGSVGSPSLLVGEVRIGGISGNGVYRGL